MSGSEPGADVLPTPRARPFEVGGPLPLGTTVLDASAGTGKTFAIAALVTRYVAELGIDLGEILVVTFTRAATAELRGRIRQRLVGARDHLAGVLDGRSAATEDPVLDALADADADELARRHRRLVEALDGIDRAQIATIHGWCQQVLGGLGLAVDLPDELTVLEDETALVEQVTRDLLIERFTDRPGAPGLTDVLDAVEAACRTPDAPLVPTEEPHEDDRADQGDDEATGRLIAWVARDARHRLAARKRRLGVVGHQDLLDVLRATLRAGTTGRRAVETLRTRTRIALIDEFQDTDPVQWDILQTLFRGAADPADPRALVLIGDPKQAIYRFRGADVGAYLAATRQATDRRTLTTNWRSDEALLAALDRLLAGSVYGETGIEHVPVDAAPGHEGSRLRGEPDACQPLVLRAVLHEGPDARPPTATSARTGLIVDDVVAQTARLLAPGTLQIPGTEGHRDLRPGDVAVLVRSNHDALVVQRALIDHGIAAVLNSVGSVFATDAAAAWADLLEALLRPSDAAAVRRVAAGPFLATDPAALIDAEEPLVDALHETIHHWGELARERGIPAVHHAISETTGLTARLLSHLGGERTLTDLEHVGALLHEVQRTEDRGTAGTLDWLRARIRDAEDQDVPSEEQARRLESDAAAVQLLTIHRSKGLEFPVVLCPFLWAGVPRASAPYTVSRPADGGWLIDVGPASRSGADVHKQRAEAEMLGEHLRLCYVALTRARHKVVAWWLRPTSSRTAAFDRLLLSRDETGRVDTTAAPALPAKDDPDGALERLRSLAAATDIALEVVPPVVRPPARGHPATDPTTLERAHHRRWIDPRWRRTSYSALIAGVDRDAAEEARFTTDEPATPRVGPDDPTRARPLAADDGRALHSITLPMARVRGSAAFGTMVHAVLERTDLAAPVLGHELADRLAEEQRRHGLPDDRDAVHAGLLAAVHTPLGPLADDRPLAGTPWSDRLDEPRFELPIGGGDRPGHPALLHHIADLLEHHLPSADPLGGYATQLRVQGPSGPLRGYLNGAIDLVLRVGAGSRARYLVVDHKTNTLGERPPTAADYQPAALADAMCHGDYPLQALLYQVALHRMLRGRIVGYDPDHHLGGVLYLFVRGMTGADAPRVDGRPCGVFDWRPPTALITDLDALLAGRELERP